MPYLRTSEAAQCMQKDHTGADFNHVLVWLCPGVVGLLGDALGHGEPQLHVHRELRLLHGCLLAS